MTPYLETLSPEPGSTPTIPTWSPMILEVTDRTAPESRSDERTVFLYHPPLSGLHVEVLVI